MIEAALLSACALQFFASRFSPLRRLAEFADMYLLVKTLFCFPIRVSPLRRLAEFDSSTTVKAHNQIEVFPQMRGGGSDLVGRSADDALVFFCQIDSRAMIGGQIPL